MVTANIPPADVQTGIYIIQSLTAAVRKNMVCPQKNERIHGEDAKKSDEK